MFDWLACEHGLPDGFPVKTGWQTKDFHNGMDTFVITEDGRLICEEWPDATPKELPDFHGDIEFYGSNVCMSGPDGYATDDDSPAWWRTYIARFTNGRLQYIRKVEGERGNLYIPEKQKTRAELHKMWEERQRGKEAVDG